jgi:hypothetical protein
MAMEKTSARLSFRNRLRGQLEIGTFYAAKHVTTSNLGLRHIVNRLFQSLKSRYSLWLGAVVSEV